LYVVDMPLPKLEVRPTPASVAEQAATTIIAAGAAAIEEKNRFHLCLAGGSTPKATYELLAGDDFKDKLDWSKVRFYFGDERSVGPDHDDSNYRMAKLAMLDALGIPEANVFRMKGEDEPEAAATQYGQMLKQTFEDGGFDLLLLGMGDDGHTASIFPHQMDLLKAASTTALATHPVSGQQRVTLTGPVINAAAEVAFLVTGNGKTARTAQILNREQRYEDFPAAHIQPDQGQLHWFLDEAAALEVGY